MSHPHGILKGKIEMAEKVGRESVTISLADAKLLIRQHELTVEARDKYALQLESRAR